MYDYSLFHSLFKMYPITTLATKLHDSRFNILSCRVS